MGDMICENKIRHFALLMSIFSFMIGVAPTDIRYIIACLVLGIFLFMLTIKNDWNIEFSVYKVQFSKSIAIGGVIGYFFVFRWIHSSKISYVSAKLYMSSSVFLTLVAFLIGLFSTYFVSGIVDYIGRAIDCRNTNVNNSLKIDIRDKFLIFIISFVTITLFSKSSFLYPFNDWVDANCFMTVGKSVLKGIVPYRDLYEQKGPLLYFIHTAAALVSSTSFIGVYVIEVIASFIVLLYVYKIALIYV
jgi:hypothetical protein